MRVKHTGTFLHLALILVSISATAPCLSWSAEFPPLPTPTPVDHNAPPLPRRDRFPKHVDQKHMRELVKAGHTRQAFQFAHTKGDDFFDASFVGPDFGVGAYVGPGQRFTRVPRPDRTGEGEWATHFPTRATGPNGMSCIECHTAPQHDGSGFVSANVVRDPLHSGDLKKMIERQTTHLFGAGAVQLVAEEMTDELQAIRDAAKKKACGISALGAGDPEVFCNGGGCEVTKRLIAKGIDFGKIVVKRSGPPSKPVCTTITQWVKGVDSDLVVRPFQWKGIVATIRDFNRGAAHNEMGMQAVELVGKDVDGDHDGSVNEISVGDMTALTVYIAGQPRPTTKVELAHLGKILPVGSEERWSIYRGDNVFKKVGCASCHTPEIKLKNPVFEEPSRNKNYRDKFFPSGDDPIEANLDPKYSIKFDLTHKVVEEFGTFRKDEKGMTRVELFSDLKRHDLGPEDAEQIDEAGTGKSTWLTRPLWGLGSTWPYMHDGRATTVLEAIRYHGGEAAGSRALYEALNDGEKKDLEAFLMNLRLFKAPDKDS